MTLFQSASTSNSFVRDNQRTKKSATLPLFYHDEDEERRLDRIFSRWKTVANATNVDDDDRYVSTQIVVNRSDRVFSAFEEYRHWRNFNENRRTDRFQRETTRKRTRIRIVRQIVRNEIDQLSPIITNTVILQSSIVHEQVMSVIHLECMFTNRFLDENQRFHRFIRLLFVIVNLNVFFYFRSRTRRVPMFGTLKLLNVSHRTVVADSNGHSSLVQFG